MMQVSFIHKRFEVLILLVLIISVFFLRSYAVSITLDSDSPDEGWLEERDGVQILHLIGSYYEMGFQHGSLLKDEILVNNNAFLHWFNKRGFFYEDLLESWVLMQPFIPFRYIQEMQGVADATGLSLEDIAVLNVGPYFVINCGSFAAWGPATHNGTMYHARSHDFPINIQDPETGAYLVEHQLLIVRKPDGFFKSVSPSLAGDVTCSDGINEMGIIPGMLSSWTADETYQGIGVGFRVRIALDCAATLEEAIHILTQNRTLGYNFIVSDGKIPAACAIETTAQLSYVGYWDTASEDRAPFWRIPYVVRRANLFVDSKLSETQRSMYNPSPFPLCSFLFKINPLSGTSLSAAGPFMHYIALSKGVEAQYGKLDLQTTMTVLRDVYTGKTDVRFFILQIFHWYSTPYQWVLCPETGNILLSFASHTQNAFESPVHLFNMFELFSAALL
ncbi:hypothetical protein AYK25_07150 [Thermoplasmatales archaeon SM1-50]|nr:MAG: hypothetical protein AYK25_07150 [Thermoplasmatales archaeon SM1-50]